MTGWKRIPLKVSPYVLPVMLAFNFTCFSDELVAQIVVLASDRKRSVS